MRLSLLSDSRQKALGAAVLANIIWATSFLAAKWGLGFIGPLTLAGLRYFLAALVLLPWMLAGRNRTSLTRDDWWRLTVAGTTAYTAGMGGYYLALRHLPVTTVSFLSGLSPLVALLMNLPARKELPSPIQIVGLSLCLAGSFVFIRSGTMRMDGSGLVLAMVGLLAYTYSTVVSRDAMKAQAIDMMTWTTATLGIGGGLLLMAALPLEGAPHFSFPAVAIVIVLTLLNTVCGYLLYNYALREVTAFEMNTLFNLLPLATAGLATVFFGERHSSLEIAGMIMAMAGIMVAQVRLTPRTQV
jgi:drug/metabolite transporter (DMT)-like permease